MRVGTYILRAAIAATVVAAFVLGDRLYAVFCLAVLSLTIIPSIAARSIDARLPVELELIVLILMVFDMTIGNTVGAYSITWYDKALHFGSSVLIGMTGFLAVYVLHVIGHTRTHRWIDGIAILLVTLGLGAAWEIAEYGADIVLGRATQGSPSLGALDDTMVDLILDGIGGAIGSVLGPIYIQRSAGSRCAVDTFAHLLGRRLHSRLPASKARGGVDCET